MYRSQILNALRSLKDDGLKPTARRVRSRLIDLYGNPVHFATIREVALAMPSHVSVRSDGDANDSFSIVLATEDVPDAWPRTENDSALTEELPQTFWDRFNQTIADLGHSWPKSPCVFGLAVSLRDRQTWLEEYSMSEVYNAISVAIKKDILGYHRDKDVQSIVPFDQSDKYARQAHILACQGECIARSIIPADCFPPSRDQENCVMTIDELDHLLRCLFRRKAKHGKKCIALSQLQRDFRDRFHRFLSPEVFGYVQGSLVHKFKELFKEPRLSRAFSVECRDREDYLVKVQACELGELPEHAEQCKS